jgi:hypothetical protein
MVRTLNQRLKQTYFLASGKHVISALAQSPTPVAGSAARLIWGRRIWDTYPLPTSPAGREVLFLHIPKCAGTSISRMLDFREYPHFPAYGFRFVDPDRFEAAIRFTVMREPVDRCVSCLMHFKYSAFATDQCKRLAEEIGLDQETVEPLIQRAMTDRDFEKKLYADTRPGFAGFNVSQVDWFCWKGKPLVHRIYAMNRLPEMACWLGEILGRELVMPHANRSTPGQARFVPSRETVDLVRSRYPRDFELWDRLQAADGVLIDP